MRQPKRYIEDSSSICKLRKYLYGLKQAPRAWYAKIYAFLLSQKFKSCKYDCNVYMQQKGGCLLLIVLYVDDFLITNGSAVGLRHIKSSLRNEFSMTNLWLLRQFIGLEVNKKYLRIMITKTKYVGYFLKRFHITYCKAAYFPFLSGNRLEEGGCTPLVYRTLYR